MTGDPTLDLLIKAFFILATMAGAFEVTVGWVAAAISTGADDSYDRD